MSAVHVAINDFKRGIAYAIGPGRMKQLNLNGNENNLDLKFQFAVFLHSWSGGQTFDFIS